MKRHVLLSALTLLAFVGCTKDREAFDAPQAEVATSYVFQERAPGLPDNPALPVARPQRLASADELTPLDQYLGMSFNFRSTILTDRSNFVLRVIDCDRLAKDHPDYVKTHGVLINHVFSYAYTSEQSYEEKSNISKKFSTGFSVDLGFFKIGRKKTIVEVFSTSLGSSNVDAFGELNIDVQHALYYLATSPYVNKLIAGEYLRPDFIAALYNNTIDNTLLNYGTFVATGYYTGGRASALYYGHKHTSTIATERMRGMQTDIEASFAWNKNSVGGNLVIGNVDSESFSSNSKFESVSMNLITYGGSKSLGANYAKLPIEEMNVDLSGWLSSLNSTSTHRLIELRDGGLQPLSDFLLEENFKQRIQQTHLGFMESSQLVIPSITICKIQIGSEKAKERAILTTRHGDQIILKENPETLVALVVDTLQFIAQTNHNSEYNGNTGTLSTRGRIITKYSDYIASQKSKYYKLKISISDVERPLTPYMIVLPNVDEKEMVKFVNRKTGMIYLYDPEQHYAFSFPDDDHTVDVYGIRDWVEQMPEKEITMLSLRSDYTIIGL